MAASVPAKLAAIVVLLISALFPFTLSPKLVKAFGQIDGALMRSGAVALITVQDAVLPCKSGSRMSAAALGRARVGRIDRRFANVGRADRSRRGMG